MDDLRKQRVRAHLPRGVVWSVLLHAAFLVPLVLTAEIVGREEAARRAEEVDVSFDGVDPDTLPEDLPPVEPEPEPPAKPDRKKARDKLAQAPETKPEREPEPDVQVPKPEEMPKIPEPPAPKMQERGHEKIVELDMGKDVEPPPDAKYLADKNNRADKETRDTRTNLERESKEGAEASSSPSDRQDRESGDDKTKIAELQDQKSQLGRQAPPVAPRWDTSPGRSEQADPRSVLAMRDLQPRAHEITPQTLDPSLPRDPDGLRAMPDEGLQSVNRSAGPQAGSDRPRLRISGEAMDYLFGEETDAARALAQKERSKKAGRFTAHLDRVRSALENFIPEVTPGNQTALNTRAVPFAKFIAHMHRSIHKVWGFGFLEDLDRKSAKDPMNQPQLAARVEIVLAQDGTIEKVGVVRSSGLVTFDAAAIDAVYSAGPYPEPPREIRSANGKIYLRWTFHRDDRQCSPAFAEPYILDNASPMRDRDDVAVGLPTPRAPQGRSVQRLRRDVDDSPAHRAKMAQLDAEAGGAEDTAAAAEASRQASAKVGRPDDPRARDTAAIFFDALVKGDSRRAAGVASFPLRAGNGESIGSAAELQRQVEEIRRESGGKLVVRTLNLYSTGGVRPVLGGVPQGFDGDASLLFGVARLGGDTFVAVLGQRGGGWRVIGLVRR